MGAARSSSGEACSRLAKLAHLRRRERASSTAARTGAESDGPSVMKPVAIERSGAGRGLAAWVEAG